MKTVLFDDTNEAGVTFVQLILSVVTPAAVARNVGITRGAVGFWYKNSKIPEAHLSVVCGMAREKGLMITLEDLK